MGCFEGIAKMFLIVVNTIILLASFGLIGIGIFVKVGSVNEINQFLSYIEQYITDDAVVQKAITYAPTIILVFGSFLCLIALLGCCGACKESRCLLGTFFGVIFILFVAQCVVAGLALGDKADVSSEIKQIVNDNWSKLTEDQVASIENLFSCSGQTSCANAIEADFMALLSTAGIALFIVAGIQLVSIISACHLYVVVGNRQNAVYLDNVQKENRAYYAA
eukprot:JP446805.1.p1 GENE.JP446805.1~~JP446805.1.p1  ORF type:complete len:221 (+),score=62.67 JP446805.1:49-711(+)